MVMKWTIYFLLLVFNFTRAFECNLKGQCTNSNFIRADSSSSNEDCLKKCNSNGDCKWYSYLGNNGQQCLQFSNCITLDESCQNCYSGQRECYDNNAGNCTTINGCCQGTSIDYSSAQDANECKEKCEASSDCEWFSFNVAQKFCVLLRDCPSVTNEDQDICTSGSVNCQCKNFDGCCQGNILSVDNANSLNICQEKCHNYLGCQWFSYNLQNHQCLLFSTCDRFTDENLGTCTSGPANCSSTDDPEIGAYILVGLGAVNGGATRSIEVIDLENGTVCSSLTDSSLQSSGGIGFMDGSNAVFCGGYGLNQSCQSLSSNGQWASFASMKKWRVYPGISKMFDGYLVTGGIGNNIESSMEFFNGQNWAELNSNMPDGLYGHCQVRINDNTSMIIGGRGLLSGITGRTWFVHIKSIKNENIEFTEGPGLLNQRHNFGCAYDEERHRIIVAGDSGGKISTEILNTNQAKPKWEFGPELPNQSPLEDFDLVYNPKFGIVLIGGNDPISDSYKNNVWKLEQNQWTPLASLKTARSGYVAINVPKSFYNC